MDATTFRSLGEVTAFVRQKTDFLVTLRDWSGRAPDDFPLNSPPVGALRSSDTDENEILAKIFKSLALAGFPTRRMVLLMTAIAVHERRFKAAWDIAKGEPDPRRRASRDAYVALRPYGMMIDVLKDWLEALHDQACEP